MILNGLKKIVELIKTLSLAFVFCGSGTVLCQGKQQELNKSLDKDLNKAESKRRELQNKFEQFRLEMDQAQIDKSLELDSSSISRDSPEVLPPEENFEEELPTAGGLLREWANVYEDPGISSESLDTEWRLQKPIPGRWEVEASPPKESKEEAVTHNQGEEFEILEGCAGRCPGFQVLLIQYTDYNIIYT